MWRFKALIWRGNQREWRFHHLFILLIHEAPTSSQQNKKMMKPSLSLIPLRINALNLHNERQPNIKTKKGNQREWRFHHLFILLIHAAPASSQIVWQFCCCDMMAFGQVWVKRPRRLGFRLVEVFPFWLDSYLAFIQIRVTLIVMFPDVTQNTRTSKAKLFVIIFSYL